MKVIRRQERKEIEFFLNQVDRKPVFIKDDAPLMLEWNTWRAMTMLDGGVWSDSGSYFEYSLEQAKISKDEKEWYSKIKEKALNW